ncbi:MAG: class I SAM-dependent methyltransferase [Thermoleophilia bacterium]|nr:class I SAM-dependent methyltransferase [Thermoleophilia bacterium]
MLARVWRRLPVPLRRLVRRARLWAWAASDRVRAPDALVPSAYGGVIGAGDFERIGAEFLDHFRTLAGLQPDERVLDIGCGLGRMAVPLTGYLTSGSYRGFDVVEPAVGSCRRRIASRYPAFRFDHLDVFNAAYNRRGRIRASAATFPYGDEEFDFAFATSVFTHMLRADVDRYLAETARVLRPGGRSLITWFVVPADARAPVGHGDFAFAPAGDGVWLVDERDPEAAVAYDEGLVRELYASAGLVVDEPIHRGTWAGGPGVSFQDLVVASRPAAPRDGRSGVGDGTARP